MSADVSEMKPFNFILINSLLEHNFAVQFYIDEIEYFCH